MVNEPIILLQVKPYPRLIFEKGEFRKQKQFVYAIKTLQYDFFLGGGVGGYHVIIDSPRFMKTILSARYISYCFLPLPLLVVCVSIGSFPVTSDGSTAELKEFLNKSRVRNHSCRQHETGKEPKCIINVCMPRNCCNF